MKAIVGLGNPGREYENTRHNVGFAVIDELAGRMSCSVRRSLRFKARIGKGAVKNEPVLLVKPLTFMNNSGLLVAPLLRSRNLGPSDLIVVLDDADLEIGRLRVRAKGSSGGHKGLDSVIENVSSSGFTRVRIGIGRTAGAGGLVEHVLARFSPEEKRAIEPVIVKAAEAVLCIVESGVDAAMNRYNS